MMAALCMPQALKGPPLDETALLGRVDALFGKVSAAGHSGFRFPEPFHNALFRGMVVHHGRNRVSQQGKGRYHQQHRRNGVMVSVEPIALFQQPARQRVDGGGQKPGNQPGTQLFHTYYIYITFIDCHVLASTSIFQTRKWGIRTVLMLMTMTGCLCLQ